MVEVPIDILASALLDRSHQRSTDPKAHMPLQDTRHVQRQL